MIYPRVLYYDAAREVMKRQGPDDTTKSDSASSEPGATKQQDPSGSSSDTSPTSAPPPSSPPPSSPPPPSSTPTDSSSSASSSQPNGSASSATPSPSPTPPPSPTSAPGSTVSSVPVSTIIQTLTTNASGQVVSTSYVTSVVVPTTVPVSNSSKSNTGPIVGGVVGGIVGAAALALLAWLLFKRKKPSARFNDDMFDPNQGLERPSRLQQNDLDLVGAEATPYVLPSTASDPSMHQHGGAPASLLGVAAGVGSAHPSHPPSSYTHSSDPSAPYSPGRLSTGYEHSDLGTETSASTRPMFPTAHPAPPTTTQLYDPRSAKEREAMAGRLNVANGGGGSGVQRDADGVIVHQDGGRYREDDAMSGSNEIPPTYDSIRQDSDSGPSRT